ncbi:MAG: cupin domain-containing protein [Candidatus Diapherotrites archaeon]|nr:cupin domain-containing protein [Candidatus Diapherotrites archaeon]
MSFELYNIPQGKIGIAYSGKDFSTGYLELEPGTELAKHNRPVLEQLMQIKGASTMIMFDGDEQKEIVMEVGDKLDIPAGQYHAHANTGTESSITLWKASGDITEIIDAIRKSSEM